MYKKYFILIIFNPMLGEGEDNSRYILKLFVINDGLKLVVAIYPMLLVVDNRKKLKWGEV